MLKYARLFDRDSGPLLIEPQSGCPPLTESIAPCMSDLRLRLLDHGALLFRNFSMPDVGAFDQLVATISSRHLKQLYRSTPRTDITDRVSTATNYPPALEIPLHCENSYQRRWPQLIAFCCIEPAVEGGETPIASMRAVTTHIGERIMSRFEEHGVEYVRHYHEGVDVPWREVFQTDSREQVREHCYQNGIVCDWLGDGLLRTSQVAQGSACHPFTNEKVFFNQAHLFHVSSLGNRAEAIVSLFGEKLPRHARFGDTSEIPIADLDRVREAFRMNSMIFKWWAGDVLLLDNMQYAHGRHPFRGRRSVFAALMDPQA